MLHCHSLTHSLARSPVSQVNHSAINSTASDPHDYLLANQWMIENVIEALDAPGEYYYDANTRMLCVAWKSSPVVGFTTASPQRIITIIIQPPHHPTNNLSSLHARVFLEYR